MARADFTVYDARNAGGAVATRYAVEGDGTSTILAGEMLRQDTGAGDTEYAQLAADGDGNTRVWLGPATSDSDETTSADGSVWVFDNVLTIFKGRASTISNLTASVRLTQVTLDVAAGTNGRQPIDENDTTNGTFRIMDFDATPGHVFFMNAVLDHISAG